MQYSLCQSLQRYRGFLFQLTAALLAAPISVGASTDLTLSANGSHVGDGHYRSCRSSRGCCQSRCPCVGPTGATGPAGPAFNAYAWAFNAALQRLEGTIVAFLGGVTTSSHITVSTSPGGLGPDTFTILNNGVYQIIWYANTQIGDAILMVNGSPLSPSLISGTSEVGGIGMVIRNFSALDVIQIHSTASGDEINYAGNTNEAINASISIQRLN